MPEKNNTSYPKEKINILFLENISDVAVKQFSKAGYTNVKKISAAINEADLVKEIRNVHLLGIRSKTQVTKNVLQAADKLQAIGCFCIGVNQVNLVEATKRGVAVFNAPYSNTRSVAELVIGASIMLVRKILDKNIAAHEGKWMKDASGSHELRGKTMGIIGYGNIGSQVSVLAEALGMKVLFYDAETKLPLPPFRIKRFSPINITLVCPLCSSLQNLKLTTFVAGGSVFIILSIADLSMLPPIVFPGYLS
jgi:D-3-phosphoglycerate dehydrogenase